MSWEIYQSTHSGIGTLCEVYIDRRQHLIKRCFHPGAKTVSGQITQFSETEINLFFKNEIYWLNKLNGEWLPELVDVCTKEQVIIQKYYGASLLDIKPKLKQMIPDVVDQVLEMYRYFKKEKVFKRNGSLSNMALKDGRILAFDFKWATARPEGEEKELYSYDHYLVKIDPQLPSALRKLI